MALVEGPHKNSHWFSWLVERGIRQRNRVGGPAQFIGI